MSHEMISVEEARKRVVALASEPRFLMQSEDVPLLDALNRVATRDLTSDIDVTPFDNSAMDGFAICADDIDAASKDNPVSLQIIDWIGAGAVSQKTVGHGQAIRIMTGAIMPAGADSVIKIEDTTFTGKGGVGDTVSTEQPCKKGINVRYAGEEAKAGSVVLRKGETINASTLGLLASTGNTVVPVYARPRIGIISIGSELVEPTCVPEPGMIRDSNAYALAGYALELGCIPQIYPIVIDDKQQIDSLFEKAVAENDVVVSSGGACDGDFDFSIDAMRRLGTVLFDLVSIRPGKAQAFGCIGDTLVHVLSGNPAAAVVGFEMFTRPALRIIQGKPGIERPITIAKLSKDTRKRENRAFYQRGHLEPDGKGGFIAVQEKAQSSALLGEMHRSNVLIELPEGTGMVPEGAEVRCMRLDIEEGTLV